MTRIERVPIRCVIREIRGLSLSPYLGGLGVLAFTSSSALGLCYNAPPMSDVTAPPVNPPAPEGPPPKGALGIIFLIVLIDLMGFGIIIPLLPFYVPDYRENAAEGHAAVLASSRSASSSAPRSSACSATASAAGRCWCCRRSAARSATCCSASPRCGRTSTPRSCSALVYASRVIDGFTGGNISTAQAYVSDVTTPREPRQGHGRARGRLRHRLLPRPVPRRRARPLQQGLARLRRRGAVRVRGDPHVPQAPRVAPHTARPRSSRGCTPAASRRSCASRCSCSCWRSRSSRWPRS